MGDRDSLTWSNSMKSAIFSNEIIFKGLSISCEILSGESLTILYGSLFLDIHLFIDILFTLMNIATTTNLVEPVLHFRFKVTGNARITKRLSSRIHNFL